MQRFTYTGYDELEKGQSIRYGELRPDKHGELIEVPYSSGSDYSGGIVDKGNFRALWKQFGRCKGVWQFNGGHGTFGIVYNPEVMSKKKLEELEDIIDGLDRSPCVDEDICTETEEEAINEAWDDYLYEDFVKAYPILKMYTQDELRCIVQNDAGMDYVFETGGTVYVDIDRHIERMKSTHAPYLREVIQPDCFDDLMEALQTTDEDKRYLKDFAIQLHGILEVLDYNAIETVKELEGTFADIDALEDEVERLYLEDWAKLEEDFPHLAQVLRTFKI